MSQPEPVPADPIRGNGMPALVLALFGLGLATLLGPAPQARVAGVALVLGAAALGFASIAERLGQRHRHRPRRRSPGPTPDAKRKP